ncbi:MAG TPA: GNAT family N-acetyltransferase [Acidimicrobiales bacterium]
MIRPAAPADVPALLGLVRELAEYERAPEEAVATKAQLDDVLFGEDPAVFCDVAEVDGSVVGMAIWFLSFSTWLGRHGVYLEDLYVTPDRRGEGHGKALLTTLARRCVERGYGRLEWSVLDWNRPAIDFYLALGATGMDEWTVHRITGAALIDLAGIAPDPSTP